MIRTVIWSALLAVALVAHCAAAPFQQNPPPQSPSTVVSVPSPEQPQKTQSAPADPAKIAAPRKAAAPPPMDVKAYVIGAEDQLAVTVWDVQKLSAPYMVRPDGKITMPLIGDIQAAGLTPQQLQGSISERLKQKYIQSPDVTVLVLQVNSKKFYIHGEVNNPGAYPLIVPTTVLEGLANARGFRDFANIKKIRIMRGTEQFRFNYKDVTHGKRTEQNIYLQPGDQIIVP
jgi:polysaccharide export outer membrane protein